MTENVPAEKSGKTAKASRPPVEPSPDPNRADLVTLLRNWQIFGIGMVFIFVGIVFSEIVMGGWRFSIFLNPLTYAEFFKDVGFAAIIAFMVSFAVERAARREFSDLIRTKVREFTDLVHAHRSEFTDHVHQQLKAIRDEVFRATFGRAFPDQYIDEIERTIFGAEFLRHGHRQIYTLHLLNTSDLNPDSSEDELPDITLMQCEVTMSYEVENISPIPQDFKVRLELEKPTFKSLIQFVRIYRVTINDKDMLPDQLQCADKDCPDTEDFRCFEYVVKDVAPGTRVRVQAYWTFLKDADDVELWRSIYPSDGMLLGVNFPREVLAKGAHAMHRVILSMKEFEGRSYYEWSIDQPVLPHQGIAFWWRSTNPPKRKVRPEAAALLPTQNLEGGGPSPSATT